MAREIARRRRGLKIRSGDQVKVVAGKDRGKSGRVLRVEPSKERLYVEGLNMVKRHVKPQKTPTGLPSRSLKAAIDFRARRTLGCWPAIVASWSRAAFNTFESCLAIPTPMFSVIFSSLGACITDEYPNRPTSAGRISSR